MQIFLDAAKLLRGEASDFQSEGRARQLLHHLGLEFADDPDVVQVRHTTLANATALIDAAARMSRIFQLNARDAPGMTFIGGTVDPAAYGLGIYGYEPAHVAGRGLDFFSAFASCVGEGVEYLSQLEWGGEILQRIEFTQCPDGMKASAHAAFVARLGKAGGNPTGPIDVLQARALATGEVTVVPANECLRRRDRAGEYKFKGFGAGCATGKDFTRATVTALLELIERDAAALWWLGGRRGRDINAASLGWLDGFVEGLRKPSASKRTTWLLDISSDIDVPTVAAMSVDASGRDFACGLAARVTLGDAVGVAIQELCQMELSNCLVSQKLAENGELALNAMDRRHLRRMTSIVAAECLLLHPSSQPTTLDASPVDQSEIQLEWLTVRLARRGIDAFVVDLTRQALEIPAVRAIAPQLQAMPSTFMTQRLRDSITATGGGMSHTRGVDLL